LILHTKGDYDSFLEMMFKTEFLLLLNKKYQAQLGRDITLKFSNRWGVFYVIFRSAHLHLVDLGTSCLFPGFVRDPLGYLTFPSVTHSGIQKYCRIYCKYW